jgi:drug/metabolite transporter (DMT)-like permease
MSGIPVWALFAIGASCFWGLAYTMIGRVVQSGVTASFILASVAMITLPTYIFNLVRSGTFKSNLSLLGNNKELILFLVIEACALMVGQYLIYHAVSLKNATSAAVVEISYPLFTCLLTWLIFRDLQITWPIAIGGALIFSGAVLIVLKS